MGGVRQRDPAPLVFVGPTIPAGDVIALLPGVRCAPPARMGDVHAAVRKGARSIGIIDGYFEVVPAVWHKEILWALSRGVRVYGAASMGALRAAEMASHGMVGVGEIYRGYRDSTLFDDDEVALLHGPAETGYAPASVPLVNIRATLQAALTDGIVDRAAVDRIVAEMRTVHYPERTFELVAAALETIAPRAAAALQDWLPTGSVDRKRLDAEELLMVMARDRRLPTAVPLFERTWIWDELVRGSADSRGVAEESPHTGQHPLGDRRAEPEGEA